MKRRFITILGFVVGLGSATSAFAQATPSPPIPPRPPSDNPRPMPDDPMARGRNFETEYYSRLRVPSSVPHSTPGEVAACLVLLTPNAGTMVGGPETPDADYRGLTQALSGRQNGCAPSGAVPLGLISGALAEHLVKKDKAKLSDRLYPTEADAAATYSAAPASGMTISTVGRCLASHSPGVARRVLDYPANTPAEMTALNALYAATPECKLAAPPAGFTAEEQRVAIATALYLWVHRR